MNKVARLGDYFPQSFLYMGRTRYGITIKCHPDPDRRLASPNPKFYEVYKGGKSPSTYEALWRLYNELPTDQHQRAFFPSERGENGCRLLLIRTDNMTVATEDMHGRYGVEVFIRKDSTYFDKLKALFKAIELDNKAEPLLNALELSL